MNCQLRHRRPPRPRRGRRRRVGGRCRSPTTSRGVIRPVADDPSRGGHGHRGRQRLRQVHAAGPGPASSRPARARCCSTARTSTGCPPGGRHPAGDPAPAADLARGHQRRRPGGPRPAPAPALVPAVVDHRRAGGRRRAGGPRLTTSPTGPSTSCRAASGSGCGCAARPRPGHRPDAARRADDVPRPGPPGGGAGLLAELNATERRTVVAVLHDLNLACRYAHHLVAMKDEQIVDTARPPRSSPRRRSRGVRAGVRRDRRPADRHAAGAAGPRPPRRLTGAGRLTASRAPS